MSRADVLDAIAASAVNDRTGRDPEGAAVEVADLLAPDNVLAGLRVNDKTHLLAELARKAASATGLPAQSVRDAIEARERLGSTGVGAGIAIPHAQIAGLERFYGLFARLQRPIDYDAIDQRPIDLAFLLLIPTGSKEHLHALACISRSLRDQTVATSLRQAATVTELYNVLVSAR